MKIILIHSGDRCGKDTTAELLKERIESFGKTVYVTSFAKPIKEDVSSFLGVTLEELDIMKNEKQYITIGKRTIETREFLVEYSRRVKDLTNENYYVRAAYGDILNSECDYAIISDLRFINEYETFKQDKTRDIYFIKIDSNLEKCTEPLLKDKEFDYVFKNEEGSIDTLKFDIETFITNEII